MAEYEGTIINSDYRVRKLQQQVRYLEEENAALKTSLAQRQDEIIMLKAEATFPFLPTILPKPAGISKLTRTPAGRKRLTV